MNNYMINVLKALKKEAKCQITINKEMLIFIIIVVYFVTRYK
jgi:hypothetical protein